MAKPLKLLDPKAGRVRLDRYELIAALAAGGMATVYLGRVAGAGGFQRLVAIKQLHPNFAHEEAFVGMFLDEGRLAAGIHHPNVVPILDIGTSEAGYYLVMEYIEGETIASLARGAMGVDGVCVLPKVAVRAALDALRGLHAAHELRDDHGALLGVVHRDVSPQNILVGVDGTARITDFGVARASARLTSSRSGEIKGKISYMAPEQLLGEEVDRRADVFAMGIVLWELLAHRNLFRGEGDAATMRRVLDAPIPNLTAVDPAIPAPLAEVVAWALSRPRDERPATCAELADALERAAQATVGVATPAEVAAYMDRLVGPSLSERRIAVREWLLETASSAVSAPLAALASADTVGLLTPVTSRSKIDASPTSPSSVVRIGSAAPPSIPASRSKRVGVIGIGVLLAVVVLAVFLRRGPAPPAAPAIAVSPAAQPPPPAATPLPAAEPIAAVLPTPSAIPTAATTSSTRAGTARGATTAKPTTRPRGGDDDMANPYR